jgi:hypothetical protein
VEHYVPNDADFIGHCLEEIEFSFHLGRKGVDSLMADVVRRVDAGFTFPSVGDDALQHGFDRLSSIPDR